MGFEKTTDKVTDVNPVTKKSVTKTLWRYDLKSELKAFERAEPTGSWKTVRDQILKQFKDFGVTEQDLGEIRNVYRMSKETVEVPRYALYNNKLVEEKGFDFNNNAISNREPLKLLWKIWKNHILPLEIMLALRVVKENKIKLEL